MQLIRERIVFGTVLALAGYLANFRSLVFWKLHPVTQGLTYQVWIEAAYWLLAMLLVLWLLMRDGGLANYCRNWFREPFLVAFLTICAVSALWSSNQAVTLFRGFVLFASTSIAAYIGMRCKPEELLRLLSWLGAAVVTGSIYMALTDPLLGINRLYGPEVWRGLFWNKNHLGSVTALFSVLLLTIINVRSRPEHGTKALLVLAYIGSLVVVYKSHSAAGYLLVLILHATMFLALLWIRLEEHMQRRHYFLLAIASVVIVAVALGNLDAVFRPFNRDATMTGRTKLWVYLLEDVVSMRPFLGYGFGSLWGDIEFQTRAYARLNFVPIIGDNGFLDILLGVGGVGLAIFLLVYFVAWKRSIRYLVREKSITGCLPLLVMSFSLFSNVSFSLLAEIEVMVWGLIVTILFATSERVLPLRRSATVAVNTLQVSTSP